MAAGVSMYQFIDTDIQTLANQVKDMILERLDREGELKSSPEVLGSKYIFVVEKKGFFGKLYDKAFGSGEDGKLNLVILENKVVGG